MPMSAPSIRYIETSDVLVAAPPIYWAALLVAGRLAPAAISGAPPS